MPYEVIKRVGERAYRYRVESYRDEKTGKPRSRWTYLGVAGGEAQPEARRRSSGAQTRIKLLAAFEALAAEQPFRDIGAGAVAERAGVGHGTFYRYFKDKRDLLFAALDAVREAFERERPNFEPPYGDATQERARVRAWVRSIVGGKSRHIGVLRAYFDVIETDDELRERKRVRRAERVTAFAKYLEALDASGTAAIPDPAALASALTVLVDGAVRAMSVEPEGFDASTAAGVIDTFERAIFGSAAAPQTITSR